MYCNMNELLTTRQVQEMLKVDRTTVYRMLKDGRLTGVKVGSQWRFPRVEIDALLYGASSLPSEDESKAMPADEKRQITLELLPTACLQAVQDVSAETVDVGAIIADNDGIPITEISNSCRFCNLILSTESGKQACINSWKELSYQHEVHPHFTTCHAGFQYARARIEVGGVPTSMFVAGQFYTKLPETAVQKQYIQQLAEKHGLDVAELEEAVREIPVLVSSKQQKITEWLEKLANTFSLIGQERAEMMERLRRIALMTDLESAPLVNDR